MLIATSTLGFSIFGLIALITLKGWELRSGRLLFGGKHSGIRKDTEQWIERVHMEFPRATAKGFRFTGRVLRAYVSFLLAKALLVFERLLERILISLKAGPVQGASRGEASAFLREIAAYKRMLGKPGRDETETLE